MIIDLKPSKNLIRLAKCFKKEGALLFIVGGFVRNSLMQIPLSDTDICGNMPYEKAIEVANNNGFSAVVINKKLGTVLISCANEQFEYTCFRKENYKKGGYHSPSEVEFVSAIDVDASRRDFTCNALYYNPLTKEVLDFYTGIEDINNKVLRCIQTPEFVFENDGLRILRMIRFAGELGFKIDKRTFKCAKRMKYQIKDISKERIVGELKKISISDLKYKTKNIDFIKIINNLKLWGVLINPYFNNLKIKLNKVQKASYITLPSELRYIGLLTLLMKAFYKNRHASDDEIACMCHIIFGDGGLKESNNNINSLIRVLKVYQHFKKNMNVDNELLINYYNLLPKERDLLLGLDYHNARLIEFEIDKKQNDNIPLSLVQLQITNTDLLEKANVPYKQINAIKYLMFEKCLDGKLKNENEELIKFAKERFE